jgi:hypothetical protein
LDSAHDLGDRRFMTSLVFRIAPVVSLGAVLSGSLACSTTRTMSRPLSDDSRAELAALQSNEWVIEYRRSLPKAIWEAARAEAAIDARADGAADSFPLDEEATKPRLEGNLLRFTSVHGRPREVPIDVLRSIRVEVDCSSARSSATESSLNFRFTIENLRIRKLRSSTARWAGEGRQSATL